uniref:GTP cyclohydrolase II n=1 Tax=Mucochytrium quahogii TaxID=96639 RepID=A0A7S2R7M6_9STRA|mmetsp:Transcript_13115/g.21267  ORF Transcript_13115/g.21267 Transcript_13115/m.21267 type:complete len:457 (-) Transcript_13115:90-1460(-)|eukprot:CAMPEP_0203745740 /NCGR_PEP_ID=MMETSP0098-20131031/1388_1 /ASSEMBLY_ACC=CAM_ASM_000208 /TAXON_ID=96639 /ORGANISM=" , Strain NY0313808BC1" /LENGTH=456 /DNA_ID=CAMNT_0050633609 /DNA_START=336 /DNA_END=1706 /DNA_ORIENTATION=+
MVETDKEQEKVGSAVPAHVRPRSGSAVSVDSTASGTKKRRATYVSITSHPDVAGSDPLPVNWGSADPATRGPIVCTTQDGRRNAIGAHGGSYCVYRALAIASNALDPDYTPNFLNTHPAVKIGPFPSWSDPKKIVTIDPFGAVVPTVYEKDIQGGLDVRPTIAITKAHVDFPEIKDAIREGRLKPDGVVLSKDGQVNVSKAAVEPVWYLPGVAERFNCSESKLRQLLFKETNGMYPELISRTDLHCFLPPIGGLTIYIFGDVDAITNPAKKLAVRVHDECNGSDVFGSDICTCRPYLAHGIEVAIKTAQEGGAGVIVYFRKEGRALGEVTKYLVYNARKRQEGGDTAAEYFNCTQNVAGVQDSRFQALMPDALQWLGITKIDLFISMSNMKYDAIVESGIEVVERVPIPEELVPKDAKVEIDAKVFAGYDGGKVYKVSQEELKKVKGRTKEELGVQ